MLNRGERLARRGDPFRSLYLIVQGAFKLVQAGEAAGEQIVSFHGPRDWIGLDGFATRVHPTDLVALQSAMVCEFPIQAIEALAQNDVSLLDRLLAYVSERLAQAEQLQHMLGAMGATQKIAFFFMHLPNILTASDSAATVYELPMTRAEIGNFLGLSMETASRLISRLQAAGAISIERRRVHLLRPDVLRAWQAERPAAATRVRFATAR
jgi:CRP/FNR family transcriptional regulator